MTPIKVLTQFYYLYDDMIYLFFDISLYCLFVNDVLTKGYYSENGNFYSEYYVLLFLRFFLYLSASKFLTPNLLLLFSNMIGHSLLHLGTIL